MKKIYTLSIFLVLITTYSVLGQWQKQDNTNGRHNSIAGNSSIVLAASEYALRYSENAGESWNNRTDLQFGSKYVLRKGNTFYAQDGSDFLVSPDGKTWERKTGYGYRMAADERTLIGAASNKVYSSSDDGSTWQLLNFNQPIGTDINSLAVAGSMLYVATRDGLYQSKDKGLTWAQVQNRSFDVLSVSASGTDVLIATRYAGILYSNDSGQTWTQIRGDYDENPVIKDSQFSVACIADNRFLVGSLYTGKVYLSEDKGKTWKDISAGLPANAGIGAIAIVDSKMYLGTNEFTDGAIWQRNTDELAVDFLLAPTSLTGNTTLRDQTMLKWADHATNEAGYKIERSVADPNNFVEIGSVPKDTTSFRDKDVVNGQTYYYRVKAYNATKTSVYSNQLAIRRLPTTCEGYATAASSPLYDVCFVSPSKAFAVGEFGKLLKTEDAGETWQDVRHCTFGTYNNILFSSPLVGYATGPWGSIMKTTDGGENWQRLPAPDNYDLGRLFFHNDTVGYVLGEGYAMGEGLYKTTDGGNTWTELPAVGDDLSDVFFTSNTTGFVCGRSNTLLKTTDGGKQWTPVDLSSLGFNKAVRRIFFVNATTGFIGGDGFIMKTTDAGKTWRRVEPGNSYAYINDIYFQNATTGYATSGFNGGVVYRTTDSGETWEHIYVGGTPYSVHFSGNTGCVVGETDAGHSASFGRILSITKDGGSTWKAISNAGYDSYSGASFITEKVGYLSHWPNAYTANNNYYKTTDGGENWLQQSTAMPGAYHIIKFFNEQKGVMVGDAVLSTEDGGKTWTKYPNEINYWGHIRGVDFVDENVWFLCTYMEGLVYKTTDGGKTLTRVSPIQDTHNTLISIDFTTAQTGFVGTLFGKIHRTTDGGVTWQVVYDDFDGNNYTGIFSINFISSQVGYAAGTKGVILKTQDGGSTWQPLQGEFVDFSQRHLVDFRQIRFFDEQTGYVASYNPGSSHLFKTTDGGQTWFGVNTFDNESYDAIHFFDQNKVLIAGGMGMVVTLDNGVLPCKPGLLSGKTREVCVGKESDYSVANLTKMSYQWNVSGGKITKSDRNTITVQWNQAGTQTLSVRMLDDCGTSEPVVFAVGVDDVPQKPTITRQNDSTLVASSQTGNQWLLNGQAIAGATTQVLTFKRTGIYSLQLTNACGSIQSDTVRIDVVTSVDEVIEEGVRVFPNPADAQVRVESDGTQAVTSIEMMDALGKRVYTNHFNAKSYTISTGSFPPGMYFIRINAGTKTIIKKVLIR